MGQAIVLPEPDDNMERAIRLAKLKPNELAMWWKLFQKFDKKSGDRCCTHSAVECSAHLIVRAICMNRKQGRVNLESFWVSIGEARSIYTDGLLDMLDIDHTGSLGFSQWLLLCITFCLFAEMEMCKYVYFVFDKDKDGYFEEEEMKLIIAILHRLAPNDRLKGNEYRSWLKVEICEDGRIEPDEFNEINQRYPRLFYPAFRLQQSMILHTAGRFWWARKKNALQVRRDLKNMILEGKKKQQQRRQRRKQERKLRRRMGAVSYLCCFWRRDAVRRKMMETTPAEFMGEETKQEIDRARHQEVEKQIKNPETLEWMMYNERVSSESKEQTVARTIEISTKKRDERRLGRQERKKDRKQQLRAASQGVRIP